MLKLAASESLTASAVRYLHMRPKRKYVTRKLRKHLQQILAIFQSVQVFIPLASFVHQALT